jgi:hypothetical protein
VAIGCGSEGTGGRAIDGEVEEDAGGRTPTRDTAVVSVEEEEDAAAVAQPDASSDAPPSFPRRPSCTTPPTLLNGDFEEPAGAMVPGWQIETTGAAAVQWDAISGYAGTGALSFRVPEDTGSGAVARQSLTLEPYTGYSFRARVASGNMRPRGDGAFLFTVVVRNGARTFTIGPRKQDRTDLDYGTYSSDFATGPEGKVELELRTAGSGHFVVDGIAVTCSERSQRYAGQSLVLTVFDSHVQSATPTNIEKVVATVEKALASYADLTGRSDPAKPSAFPLVGATTEARGNPALWGDGASATTWSLPGFAPPGLLTALARNFDRPAWLFEEEMAQLLVYHAAETHDLVQGNVPTGRGKGARLPFEASYNNDWKAGGCATGLGLVYKHILIADQIGWEPFKKAFRFFDALPAAEIPAGRGERLKRWLDKLAELSGKDVWTFFTPLDRMLIDARYGAPALPPQRTLAMVPPVTLMVPLDTVQWDSATARDRPTRNRLPNECGMTTAAGPATSALHAHPFSQYVYRLGRRWKRLLASQSLLAGQTGSVVFIVRGDGRELSKSMVVRDAMPRPIDLDVSMVDRLELVVTDAGDGFTSDGALWLNPRLTR